MNQELLRGIQETLANLGIGAALVSSILFLARRRNFEKPFKYFVGYLFFNALISLAAGWMWRREMPNLPLLHLNTLIEFILFSFFYKTCLPDLKWFNKIFKYFVVGGSILIVANSIFLESIYVFNTIAKSITQIIFIVYAVSYIYSFSIKLEEPNINTSAIQLINAAVLIYYASSFFIFLFSNVFMKNDIKIHLGFWIFNAALHLIFQLLILIGIWKVAFKPTKSI